MASGQTSNLALSQWGASDRVTRADFNGDNQKIDAAVGALRTADTTMQGSISTLQGSVSSLQTAVAGKCSVIVGTYTGDGAAERTISLGVTPKAVFVCSNSGSTLVSYYSYGGLALRGSPVKPNDNSSSVTVTSNGFTVGLNATQGVNTNSNAHLYHYFALY